jgi:hypothetical protein
MGTEGMGFFLSDTDEDHRIVHWGDLGAFDGQAGLWIPYAQIETEGWLAARRSS